MTRARVNEKISVITPRERCRQNGTPWTETDTRTNSSLSSSMKSRLTTFCKVKQNAARIKRSSARALFHKLLRAAAVCFSKHETYRVIALFIIRLRWDLWKILRRINVQCPTWSPMIARTCKFSIVASIRGSHAYFRSPVSVNLYPVERPFSPHNYE